MEEKFPLRFRFTERDYVFNLILLSTDYITEDEINSILDEYQWQDLTFIIFRISTGFKTKIIDNRIEEEININQLNPHSYDFYIRTIEDLSAKIAENEIEKIRLILHSVNNKEIGVDNERETKTYQYTKFTNNRLKKIAQ